MKNKRILSIISEYYPNVTNVIDAKSDLPILITKQDFKKGKIKSPDSCAMAKAIEREHDGAIISLSTAYVIDGNKAIRYKVPDSVAREIVSFDRNSEFAPGSYTLKMPSPSLRLTNKPKTTKPTNKSKKEKRTYHRTVGLRVLKIAQDKEI